MHCICPMWVQKAVWVCCQPQSWLNDIILTIQVTQNPKICRKKCGNNYLRLLSYDHGQHINVLKHFVCVWIGRREQFELAVNLNHDIASFWLHKWPKTTKSGPGSVGIWLRLLTYAPKQHINVLKHFVYALYGCRKQFEVAVRLNHDVMTSIWLHMWCSTP